MFSTIRTKPTVSNAALSATAFSCGAWRRRFSFAAFEQNAHCGDDELGAGTEISSGVGGDRAAECSEAESGGICGVIGLAWLPIEPSVGVCGRPSSVLATPPGAAVLRGLVAALGSDETCSSPGPIRGGNYL